MFSLNTVYEVFVSILSVIPETLGLALTILFIATFTGLTLAIIRLNKFTIASRAVVIFVSFIRGTPLIVQLYIVYYAFPLFASAVALKFGTHIDANDISPIWAVIITYSVNSSAIQSENIRSAFLSIDKGQIEAAHSIGLSSFQILRRVIIPQAMTIVVPNTCNAYIITIKSLSLAFTVSVVDILAKAKLCSALNFRYIESYVAAALMYWILCSTMTYIFSTLNKNNMSILAK